MRPRFVLACLLLAGAVRAHAGSASAAFPVTVTIATAGSTACTTTSGPAGGLQLQCTPGVFVNIAQVAPMNGLPVVGQFIGAFGRLREDALPVRASSAELFDDSLADAERGWNFNGQLYALNLNAPALQLETKAQLKQKNNEGVLTAVLVNKAPGGPDKVEMLVSF